MNKRKRQRMLRKRAIRDFIWSSIIAFIFIIISLINSMPKDTPAMQTMGEIMLPEAKVEAEISLPTLKEVDEKATLMVSITSEPESIYPVFTYSKDWDVEEDYLLAKIAMAEAEGCSIETKIKVIQTILNRVHDNYFPNTIYDVIHQKSGKIWQFSPLGNGRWKRVEPNEECYEAVRIVKEATYDESQGVLYFESMKSPDNWHSRNLEFLYEIDGMRFYK
ncbi:MAG: cell wall hydrolase [Candidatus Pacebacteria bacterium]|nr:cell wall hydrolase [Candidatus Paceibacterota bacterium]